MHRNITFTALLLSAILMIMTTNSDSDSLSGSDSIESLLSDDNAGLDTSFDLNLILELLQQLTQESNDQDEEEEALDDNTTEQTLTESPTIEPTNMPSGTPSNAPSKNPSNAPSRNPTSTPSETPTKSPTNMPSNTPSSTPSTMPTKAPSETPTAGPTSTPPPFCSNAPVTGVCGTMNNGNSCRCAFNGSDTSVATLICVESSCSAASLAGVCSDPSNCTANQECTTATNCAFPPSNRFCFDPCDNPNPGSSGTGAGTGSGTSASIPIGSAHSVNINNKDIGTDYKQFNDQSDDDKNGPNNISYVIDISTNVWILLFMISLCGAALVCGNIAMLRGKQEKVHDLNDECYK